MLTSQAALKVTEEQLALEWRIAPQLLRGRARMEESGTSNALFVSDTAQLLRLGRRRRPEAGRDRREVEAQLKGIADALKTLEAAHELALLENALKNLPIANAGAAGDRRQFPAPPRLAMAFPPSPCRPKNRTVGLAGDAKLNDIITGSAAQAVAREMKSRTQQAGFC